MVLSLFVLIGVSLIILSLFPERFIAEAPPSSPSPKITPPPPPPVTTEITKLPIASDAATSLASADSTTEDDLSTIELLLTTYARHHHGNPIGENIEITAALLGKNPSRAAFLEKGSYLDATGQLVDRWRTPYFFHQLSGKQTEIRSAGPDREFHTADDLVR